MITWYIGLQHSRGESPTSASVHDSHSSTTWPWSQGHRPQAICPFAFPESGWMHFSPLKKGAFGHSSARCYCECPGERSGSSPAIQEMKTFCLNLWTILPCATSSGFATTFYLRWPMRKTMPSWPASLQTCSKADSPWPLSPLRQLGESPMRHLERSKIERDWVEAKKCLIKNPFQQYSLDKGKKKTTGFNRFTIWLII